MTLYGKPQLIAGIRAVRADTICIAQDIPAEQYDFRPVPESRSAAETLVHIASLWTLDRRLHGSARLDSLEQFDFAALIAEWRAEETRSRTKAEIVEMLRVEGERFAIWLDGLDDSVLAERVRMADGGSASRFDLIVGTREHEIHHRAQLTVIERLVGVVPHFIAASSSTPEPELVES